MYFLSTHMKTSVYRDTHHSDKHNPRQWGRSHADTGVRVCSQLKSTAPTVCQLLVQQLFTSNMSSIYNRHPSRRLHLSVNSPHKSANAAEWLTYIHALFLGSCVAKTIGPSVAGASRNDLFRMSQGAPTGWRGAERSTRSSSLSAPTPSTQPTSRTWSPVWNMDPYHLSILSYNPTRFFQLCIRLLSDLQDLWLCFRARLFSILPGLGVGSSGRRWSEGGGPRSWPRHRRWSSRHSDHPDTVIIQTQLSSRHRQWSPRQGLEKLTFSVNSFEHIPYSQG